MKPYPITNKRHFEAILGFKIVEIDLIISDLNTKKGNTKYYYSFIKRSKKPGGKIKERKISPARYELSLIQDRIKDRILNHIPLPNYIYGGRKGVDAIKSAKVHKGKNNHFSTDLKDFFPYVTKDKVYKAFTRLGIIPDFASRLTRLTTFEGHLPQGASTSTMLANLVFHFEIGSHIERIIKDRGITMSSFVDDLNLSSEQQFNGLDKEVLQIILNSGFRYKHQKTVLKKGKIDMTGVNVSQNQAKATEKIKKKLIERNRSEKSKEGVRAYINRVERGE